MSYEMPRHAEYNPEYTLDPNHVVVPYAEEPGLIPKDIFVNMVTVTGQKPSILMALGMGNEGEAPYMAQDKLIPHGIQNVAFLEGLPYHKIAPEHLMRFGVDATRIASERLAERNGGLPTWLIRESQAAPSGVVEFWENPEAYERLDLLHPLGFTILTRGEFFGAMLRTALQPDQLKEALGAAGYIGRIAAKRGIQDLMHGGKRLDVALQGADVRKEWLEILQKYPGKALMTLNSNDRLFPHFKIEAASKKALEMGIISQEEHDLFMRSIRTIHGSHSSPATRAGALQIADIISYQGPQITAT